MGASMGIYIKIAGAVAALVTFGICAVLVAPEVWDNATIASILALSTAAWLTVSAPPSILGYGGSRTGTLASVGINGFVLSGFIIFGVISFIMAMKGIERSYVWASTIFSFGWLFIGMLISREALNYLDKSFPDQEHLSFNIVAQNELNALLKDCKNEFTNDIQQLIEKMRFASSDLGGKTNKINNQIILLIRDDLNQSIQQGNRGHFNVVLLKIRHLLKLRDSQLSNERKMY
jgi:hypothetical protein